MSRLDLRRTMSPARLVPFDYASLADPEAEQALRDAAATIREHQRVAVIDIGRTLLTVKDRLDHGKFVEWIEAEFPFTRRTAARMMLVATEFGGIWDAVSHLPSAILYQIAAPSTPPAVREAVLNLAPGEVVTPRGVRAAILAQRKADQPKPPRLGREEREAQRTAQEARWAAHAERDRKEMEAREAAARTAVESLLAMVGNRFAELSDLIAEVEPYRFAVALREAVQADRAARGQGGAR